MSTPAAPSGTGPASPRRFLALILVLAGGLLLTTGVIVTVLLLRNDDSPTKKGDDGLTLDPSKKAADPRLEKVQPAIDRGVAFLRETLRKKAEWNLAPPIGPPGGEVLYGMYGLIGLTLLECGVPAEDPDVLTIAEELRKGGSALTKTYAISATLFFFNRWSMSKPLSDVDRKLARTLGVRLCAGQIGAGLGKGVWHYDCPVLMAAQEEELLEKLNAGQLAAGGAVRFYSVSNTQFAMLALWGARKHGVPVRPVLLHAAEHFHRTQFADGHWVYDDTQNPTVLWTTATAAGLMALAMEKALLEDREFNPFGKKDAEAGKRADVAKAFEYVGKSIGRKKGDPGGAKHDGKSITPLDWYVGSMFQADSGGDLYYLWTIERLGVIYSMPVIEGKDWYDWGYPLVLEHQKADGSWRDRWPPQIDTCFALLFLKRANLAQDLTTQLQRLGMPGR